MTIYKAVRNFLTVFVVLAVAAGALCIGGGVYYAVQSAASSTSAFSNQGAWVGTSFSWTGHCRSWLGLEPWGASDSGDSVRARVPGQLRRAAAFSALAFSTAASS